MKRFIALFFTGIMLIFNTSATLADTVQIYDAGNLISETYINPYYTDVITQDDLNSVSEYSVAPLGDPEYVSDISYIAESIRQAMVAREENLTVYISCEEALTNGFLGNWIDQAIVETEKANEGDYLALHYGGASASGNGYYDYETGNLHYTINIVFTYYTNAEQESAVDQAVASLIAELEIDKNISDYNKVKKVYDYICSNVTYDYKNLYDDTYQLKYTAYAALINKTAVCQGYANLMYRVLKEAGVDIRSVSGTGNGGRHAWNLVGINGVYYFADATWDAVRTPYEYFLKGTTDFGDHVAESTFLGEYTIPETGYIMCNHVWDDEPTVDIAPSYTDIGYAYIHCGVCGDVKEGSEVIIPVREDIENLFTDINNNAWYYSAVKYAYKNGLLTGTSDVAFAPNDPMTRGMLVTVLYRLDGRPAVSANAKFPDVASSKYYAKAISWASEENIVSGYSNGNFGPNDSITREQIAKVLYRYAEYKGYDVTASQSLDGFSDASSVSSYAKKYMQWATAEGLIKGSNGVLNPKGDATRAEISAILKRFIQKYE